MQDVNNERELQKVKNMLITGFYRDMATISGRAQQLGSFEVFHDDWRKLFDVVATYEAITPEDVQRVAGEVFRAGNRSVVTLVPTETSEGEGE